MRLESGGLHSNSYHQCLPLALQLQQRLKSEKKWCSDLSPPALPHSSLCAAEGEKPALGLSEHGYSCLGQDETRSAINLREPELRPFKTFFLHLWYSMYSANHPRPQILRAAPTSAGFIDFSWVCENQTSMPYTEFPENNEENISSYFQKIGGRFLCSLTQELYDRTRDESYFS